jgi:hypothetical protein
MCTAENLALAAAALVGSVCRLMTQQIDTSIRIQQNKQQDVRIFTPFRYTLRYGSTVYALFAVVRNPRATFVYSDCASPLWHVYGEGNKVTPFLEMENIYHHAVKCFKCMKSIPHSLGSRFQNQRSIFSIWLNFCHIKMRPPEWVEVLLWVWVW